MLRPVLLASGLLSVALLGCGDPAGLRSTSGRDQVSADFLFGGGASIGLHILTNDEDADVSPGPFLSPGDPVEWEYHVTNTGSEDLSGVYVMDDQEGPICAGYSLYPGEQLVCTKIGVARAGSYENEGTATGFAALSGQVVASDWGHYQGGVSVEEGIGIDVKPGSDSNCLNPSSNGRLPVAILADAGFDPLTLDPASILAGGVVAPVKWGKGEDVSGDGLLDLVVHFKTPELNDADLLQEGAELVISGEMSGGGIVSGSDIIHLVHGPFCN